MIDADGRVPTWLKPEEATKVTSQEVKKKT